MIRRFRFPYLVLIPGLFLSHSLQSDSQPTQAGQVLLRIHLMPFAGRVPVKVEAILLDGRALQMDEDMSVPKNWAAKLQVVVENTSPKDLVYGSVDLLFPESGDGTSASPYNAIPLRVGRPTEASLRKRDGTVTVLDPAYPLLPIDIKPGRDVTFAADQSFVVQKDAAGKRVGHPVTAVNVRVSHFFYADDSQWTGSSYLMAVTTAQLWRPMTEEEFYSDKGGR